MSLTPRGEGMRGTGLLALLLCEEERCGKAALRARLEMLPEAVRAELDFDVQSFGLDGDAWYPPAFVHALADGVAAGLSAPILEALIRDAARHAVRTAIEIRPTYAALDSPERVTRLLNAAWRSAFSDGTLRVVPLGPRRIAVHRSGWSGHHPLVCRFGMEAMAALYEASGAASARIEITGCVSRGDPDCNGKLDWS